MLKSPHTYHTNHMCAKCLVSGKEANRRGCHCSVCIKVRKANRLSCRRQYAKNPQRRLTTTKAWMKRNPDKIAANDARKRERRDSAKKFILEALGGCCALCGFKPQVNAQIHLHELNGNIAKKHGNNNWRPGQVLLMSRHQHLIFDNLNEIVPLCGNCHTLAHHKTTREETCRRIVEWKQDRLTPQF